MKNIINYVEEETRTFTERPLSGVDSLIFSQLSYLNLEQFVPNIGQKLSSVLLGQIAFDDNFDALCDNVIAAEHNRKLLKAIAVSPRFRDIGVNYHVRRLDLEREEQFSAVTFVLGDDSAHVTFRGTDATLVGWKEDFNMAFSDSVPSQIESVRYLNKVGRLFDGALFVGGHSKGGNLAVYAAMYCDPDIRERITDVFSHDGPGFREGIFQSEEYGSVKPLLRPYVPQTSLVGMLLEQHEAYTVIKSRQIGIMQHDPFTWMIKDNDFHYLEELTSTALYGDKVIQKWLDSLSDADRERFVDTLFGVIEATGAMTFFDLTEDWWKKAGAAMDALRDIDDDTGRFISQALKNLFAVSLQNLKPDFSFSSILDNIRETDIWKRLT